MPNDRDRIKKILKQQQKDEGFTPETALLLKVVEMTRYGSEWRLMTKCEFVGTWPNNKPRFYPSDLLLKLQKHFEEDSV